MLCISLTGLFQVLGLGCLVVVPHCTMPAATTVLSDTSALDIAPGAPAAAHSREALAEVANTVCCAETSPDRS